MAETDLIALPFKGTRPYIHSTDLWNSLSARLAEELGGEGALRINIRAISGQDLRLCSPDDIPSDVPVIGDVLHKTSNTRFLLVEAEQPASGGRVADHEAEYEREIGLEGEQAAIPAGLGGTPIETIVHANKMLLTHLFPDTGKWLAVSLDIPLDLRHPPEHGLTVAYKSSLPKHNTYFSELHDAKGGKIGAITFIGVDAATYKDMEDKL